MTEQEIWSKASALLKDNIEKTIFETFIENKLQPLAIRGNTFYFSVAISFYQDYVQEHYLMHINEVLAQVTGQDLNAVLLNPDQASEISAVPDAQSLPERIASPLNERYTFETFVVGKNNELAHAASVAVSEHPGASYNPLFIYGGVGLGKTHLMHAIGNRVLKQDPQFKIIYITSEAFVNEMVDSITKHKQNEFREKYRSIDMLMIDDIQFLTGKTGTQEEFFHTFNALYDCKKQIIISSDKPPKEIARLEERLVSRFSSGLVVDITKPELETRLAILQQKAKEEHMDIESEVLTMIAERVPSNIRELEGCLNRLRMYSSLSAHPIDREFAEDALKEIFSKNKPRQITCHDVMEAVSSYYNVTIEDLIGTRRTRDFVVPRQVAIYLARELVKLPLSSLGEEFGHRDHSTINHACQKVVADMKSTPSFNDLVKDFIVRLSGQS